MNTSKLLIVASLLTFGCASDPGEGPARPDASPAEDASGVDAGEPGGEDARGGDDASEPDARPEDAGGASAGEVVFRDGAFEKGGEPFPLRAVAWNPVARGDVHPRDLDFAGFVEQDAPLMQAAGINAVRTYEPIRDTRVLDVLLAHDVYVLMTVYPFGGDPVGVVRENMEAALDHPAVIMWVVGNEWNYNGLYAGLSFDDTVARVGEAVDAVREVDATRPVSTIYGEVPSVETIEALSSVDVWGINAYRSKTFGDLFDVWASRSDKPMYMGEFGADAWNADTGMEDQGAQAEATRALLGELEENAPEAGGPCLGGAIFEFADEWWKDSTGSPDVHDTGGIAPGGGPYPDAVFNEEWWGLVTIDREPRAAYRVVEAMWGE
jgi:hypothetical protein